MDSKKRCEWCNLKNTLYIEYHDNEWCVPNFNDKYLYEMLLLESFQAGLSWECVLNKRDSFRKAYDDFDLNKVISYDDNKVNELLSNKDIRIEGGNLIINGEKYALDGDTTALEAQIEALEGEEESLSERVSAIEDILDDILPEVEG